MDEWIMHRRGFVYFYGHMESDYDFVTYLDF